MRILQVYICHFKKYFYFFLKLMTHEVQTAIDPFK